jgi:hypothetical protein
MIIINEFNKLFIFCSTKLTFWLICMANLLLFNEHSTGQTNKIHFEPEPIRSFPTISANYAISNADFDGDGNIDVVSTNWFDDGSLISIQLNKSKYGSIFLAEPYLNNITCNIFSAIEASDFDQNGRPDILFKGYDIDSLIILRNHSIPGSLNFESWIVPNSENCGSQFLAYDFNGDGNNDIVTFKSDSLVVFQNESVNGHLQFRKSFSVFVEGQNFIYSRIAKGDFDNNGKMDLAISATGSIFVLQNLSTEENITFSNPIKASKYYATDPIAVADFDNDGKTDILCQGTQEFVILKNSSTADNLNFGWEHAFSFVDYATSVSVCNLDKNDKPDIIVTVPWGLFSDAGTHNYIKVFQNMSSDDNFQFIDSKYEIGFDPRCVTSADLDNDGDLDLAVGCYQGCSISVLQNQSDNATIKLGSSYKMQVGYWPWSISLGDFDNNGKPDLVTGNWGSRTVSVLINKSIPGEILFEPNIECNMGYDPPEYPSGFVNGGSISIADFDGDGNQDIAVANDYAEYVSVLRNSSLNENISFALPDTFTTSHTSERIVSADFDGDLKPDLLIADGIMRNTSMVGKIRFDPPLPPSSFGFAAADLDGDGKVDIIGDYIYQNKSTIGNFHFEVINDGLPEMYIKSIAVGDCDGDGKIDFAYTNTEGEIEVRLNKSSPGNIDFSSPTEYLSIREARAIALYNLVGDEKPDIIINNQDFEIAVLENISTVGSLGFTPSFPGTVILGNSNDLCIADFDGDSYPDIAATSAYQNQVCIIRTSSAPVSYVRSHNLFQPSDYLLEPNYPNPFNSTTSIVYQISKTTEVHLEIYNSIGELIKILIDENPPAGYYTVNWNGNDGSGNPVASGVYFCTLRVKDFVQSRKLVLIR